MNIGKAIRRTRKQKNLQQQEVAEKTGISAGYLSQIENGKRDPNLSTLHEISDALEVPLPFLLWIAMDEEDIPPKKRDLYRRIEPILQGIIDSLLYSDER